jgi:hypothetical protein
MKTFPERYNGINGEAAGKKIAFHGPIMSIFLAKASLVELCSLLTTARR